MNMTTRYQRPGWFTKNVFQPLVAGLARLGISIRGSAALTVPGRRSGRPRVVPVNPLSFEGGRYLVAPRGHTQWVRNLRAAGEGRLRVGRRDEAFRVTELADDDKPALLRAYLRLWRFEVGMFFDGVGPEALDEELRRIAPDHPVFRMFRSGPMREAAGGG
jgi:deazaflavin-dependent oxidoreductase (nitroreductase family)